MPPVYRGLIAHARGDDRSAWAIARACLPGGPREAPGERPCWWATAAQRLAAALAIDAGELPAAREWLDAHDRWLAWSGAVRGRAEGQTLWGEYYRAAGDAARASRHAVAALAHAGDPRQPLALLAAHRLLGELDTTAGRYDDAAPHLEASLALADACRVPYERALALLALAELHAARRDRDAALRLIDTARALLAPLDAEPALARADALADRLARAPSPALPYPAGLTMREVEVLRLVAAGRSNRAIADALSISERTVNRHITNLYTKIDAHSKAEATAYALRHALA
jgi:DNA-binding CsgD family transcriptional regulator